MEEQVPRPLSPYGHGKWDDETVEAECRRLGITGRHDVPMSTDSRPSYYYTPDWLRKANRGDLPGRSCAVHLGMHQWHHYNLAEDGSCEHYRKGTEDKKASIVSERAPLSRQEPEHIDAACSRVVQAPRPDETRKEAEKKGWLEVLESVRKDAQKMADEEPKDPEYRAQQLESLRAARQREDLHLSEEAKKAS